MIPKLNSQALAPLCSQCQQPLSKGPVIESVVVSSPTDPSEVYALSTVSVSKCPQCLVFHRIYLSTSLEDIYCMVLPYDVETSEEARRFHLGSAVSEIDVAALEDTMVSGVFEHVLGEWIKEKEKDRPAPIPKPVLEPPRSRPRSRKKRA